MTCGCGTIDVHTHIVPMDFPPYLGSHANAAWPSMTDAQPCHRHVMISGKAYRTVSHHCWDTGVRIADMDSSNIERQVLSPMPELLAYWLDPDDGRAMARFLNDTVTQLVQSAPARFSGLGAVPMQDVDAAIEELDFIMHQAGLSGVEIAGNINGVPIGDSRFAPFFEAAEKWGAAVFVHPLRPVGLDRLIGPPVLEQALAFPGEIGLAAASLVTGGTLARHRGLRIAFSHGGGSLSVLLSRLHHAWESFPQLKETMAVAPRDIARSIYVDSLLYDPRMVEGLVQFFGETRVMVGSDYPFAIMERDPHGAISSLEVDERVKQMLRSENARRWLGMRDTV